MSRPVTPTKVLEARGAFKRNPQRKNHKEPVPGAKLDAEGPEHFNARQLFYWHDIIKRCPAGVLFDSDYYVVMLASILLEDIERDHKNAARHATKLISALGKLGMSPSDRAGLKVDKPKANPFSDV